MNLLQAENIAVSAIQYLSVNEDYFASFMNYTGCAPDQIEQAVKTIHFQISILDFMCLDESLLLSFCQSSDIEPSAPYSAFQFLSHQ